MVRQRAIDESIIKAIATGKLSNTKRTRRLDLFLDLHAVGSCIQQWQAIRKGLGFQ